MSKYSLNGIFPQPRSSDIFFIAALSLISVLTLLDPTHFGLFQTWGADLPPSFSSIQIAIVATYLLGLA